MRKQLREPGRVGHLNRRPQHAFPVFNRIGCEVQPQRRSTGAALHRKVDSIAIQRKIVAFHGDVSVSSVNEGSGLLPARKGYDPHRPPKFMSGEVRKGERIPRREPPAFEEAETVIEAWTRDGFLGTALDDANQFGPITMMLLLLIVATITGTAINFFA